MSFQTSFDEASIRRVVDEVLSKLQAPAGDPRVKGEGGPDVPGSPGVPTRKPASRAGRSGVFAEASEAIEAAAAAFHQLRAKGFAGRARVIEIVKRLCHENAKEWGRIELEETKIGRLEHKVEKLLGIPGVPGVEYISPRGMSGDHGITMEEHTPFGVIGAVTPVTHSIPTIACNIVSMVAAGNTVVFNAHPGGKKCAALAVRAFNEAIKADLGIDNIATLVEEPSLESFDAIKSHPLVSILCVTGGPGIVKAAMASGKRAICAGPGNPPVVVDETADLDKAAKAVIFGGGYDNNLLCIGEKQVFVVEQVYGAFLKALEKNGAAKIGESALEKITKEAFPLKGGEGGCSKPVLNREFVGMDPVPLADRGGVKVPAGTPLLYAQTDSEHLFVEEEQMMPLVPVVRTRNVESAVALAKKSEHGYKHSAMIHSKNIDAMTHMAKELDTTLFVKNGSCLAGLGVGGEGYASFSIATTTGEGITTPLTFTRTRRCVMVDNLNIF